MRHLLGIVIGIVLTAIALAAGAYGVGRLVSDAQAQDDPSLSGLLWALAGGVLLGLLAAARRISPLVPLIAGAALVTLGVFAYLEPAAMLRYEAPVQLVWDGLTQLAFSGAALMLGALLVVLALVPQGRRVRRAKGDDGREDDGFTAVPERSPQAWSPPER